MMGIAPQMGRQQAHDLVYEACREALESRRMLFDILNGMPPVKQALDEAALKKLCDPANYLGASAAMTDRVLAARKK